MDINDGVRLLTQYIQDRKGIQVDINPVKIMTNQRQLDLLNKASPSERFIRQNLVSFIIGKLLKCTRVLRIF